MDGSKYVAQICGFKYPYSPLPGHAVSGTILRVCVLCLLIEMFRVFINFSGRRVHDIEEPGSPCELILLDLVLL